jgi:hypothetical protein
LSTSNFFLGDFFDGFSWHQFIRADYVFSTGGGFHVPLRIEEAFCLGQYMRSIAMKSPFGAGNQFASLSAPGVSFWK